MNKKKFFFNYKNNIYTYSLFLFLISTVQLQGQVSIGSSPTGDAIEPNDFSVLELISNTGGLRLPHLTTEERDTLSNTDAFKAEAHRADLVSAKNPGLGLGLIIYNTSNNTIEYWDGIQWARLFELSAINGLSLNGHEVELGGTLSKATNLNIGTNSLHFNSDKGSVTVAGSTSAPTLDIEGNLRIGSAPSISNASALVRDDNTGIIGTAVAIPPRFAFIQSTQGQKLATQQEIDLFNTGIDFKVTWDEVDIVSNNVVAFDNTNDYFVINQDGLYELSGFLNYAAYSTIPPTYPTTASGGRSGVNATIQIDKNDGNGWTDFTAARYTFTGTAVNNTAVTIVIPPGVSMFTKGTKIRMTFRNPSSNFGLPHGTSGSNGITLPTGVQFTKGMKILAL